MKNAIPDMNTLEGIKNRLEKAEDWIRELEDKVEKKTHNKKYKMKKDSERMRIV